MSTPIQTVLIYGYGVMGRGVARTFAEAGFATFVKSSRAGKLEGLPAKTSVVERLPKEAPDLVIEFVPEDVRVKQAVYAEVEAAYPGEAPLIATGTSGLDLVELARKMKRPERFLGIHYFMPADTAPVVEVMAGLATSRADVDRVADALRRTGKEPVVLYKPIVGFLVNRLQHAILHEAYYLIEAGVASAEDIDHAARRMLAPRMCLNGLIQQKDISGLKIHADQDPRRCPGVDRAEAVPQRDSQSDAPDDGRPRPHRALGGQRLLRLERLRRGRRAQTSFDPTRQAARIPAERDRPAGAGNAAEGGLEVTDREDALYSPLMVTWPDWLLTRSSHAFTAEKRESSKPPSWATCV